VEVDIREILTSVLQGRKRSASRSSCFIPWESALGGWVVPKASLALWCTSN